MLASFCGQGHTNTAASRVGTPLTAPAMCLLLTPRRSMLRMQTPLPPALHMQGAPGPLGSGQEQGWCPGGEGNAPEICRGRMQATGRSEPSGGWEAPSATATYPIYSVVREQPGKGPCRVYFYCWLCSQASLLALSPIIPSCIYNSDSCSHPECIDFSTHLLTPLIIRLLDRKSVV